MQNREQLLHSYTQLLLAQLATLCRTSHACTTGITASKSVTSTVNWLTFEASLSLKAKGATQVVINLPNSAKDRCTPSSETVKETKSNHLVDPLRCLTLISPHPLRILLLYVQHAMFMKNKSARKRYWLRSMVGYPRLSQSKPNPAHVAITELQTLGHIDNIITQNVSGKYNTMCCAAAATVALPGCVCVCCSLELYYLPA